MDTAAASYALASLERDMHAVLLWEAAGAADRRIWCHVQR
jgi:hypothetical protein